jgi:D-glycero-D-manno-heptose 1,7-bisphosphate phosphatase
MKNIKRPAVLLDRDGVINHDYGYVHSIDKFEWIDGAIDAIKLLNELDWLVIVITNQSGIARGYYDEKTVIDLHQWIQEKLVLNGAHIDSFYYCPHHPSATIPKYKIKCLCRKPEPGMLLNAIKEWNIDMTSAFFIGDRMSDIQAAEKAGIKGVLFNGKNLYEFVSKLIQV